VSYVLPLVAVPVASAIVFIIYDTLRFAGSHDPNAQWIVLPRGGADPARAADHRGGVREHPRHAHVAAAAARRCAP
jgi:hypothetical protein